MVAGCAGGYDTYVRTYVHDNDDTPKNLRVEATY